MKKLIFFLLLILPLSSFAQTKDRVYLKNGSIINGTISEMYPDSIVKFYTNDGSLFVFNSSEVLKIESNKKEVVDKSYISEGRKAYALHSGYRGFVDFGISPYSNSIEEVFYSFSTTHGYQFNKHWFVGAGFSLSSTIVAGETYLPIFVDGRYTMKGRSGLYVDAKVGYLPVNGDTGSYTSLGIGYRFAIAKNFGINTGVSFDFYRGSDYNATFNVGVDF